MPEIKKPAGRKRAMGSEIGPSVIAASVILAMTLVLYWSHATAPAGPTWLARMLAQPRNKSTIVFTPPAPFQNITGKLLDELARNGTAKCHNQRTNSTKVIGLPEKATLSTNTLHRFWLQSYTHDGAPRCAGGDYYELDLSSPLWKSRPGITDLQNGTYAVELLVPDAFAGETFNFSAHLLFDAYHGLDFDGWPFKIIKLTASLTITFVTTNSSASSAISSAASNLNRCNSAKDFSSPEWRGRWTRHPLANETCAPDAAGRYLHCFNSSEVPCRNPTWCSGDISRLESVGWSYSAHCAFHIFSQSEAWDCLAGRYLFFWGDSNHQDTVRNLLTLILGISPPPGRDVAHFSVDRVFQSWFRNPSNLDQELRITSHFNGHPHVDNNYYGLDSLHNDQQPYRNHIRAYFQSNHYPDTVIMNSGLHDGTRHRNLDAYIKSVDNALEFWQDVFTNVKGDTPNLIYRTTVTPAGRSRGMQANPHKLEVYNRVIVEKVTAAFPAVKLVDAFDVTFPFHYDNSFSDGGHYGRAPGSGMRYFVDVMVAHALLNAICKP